MTDTAQATGTEDGAGDELLVELKSWLEENWDPEITVAEWWDRLGSAGWSAPAWPADWYGKGVSPGDAVRVQRAIGEFGALGAPGGLGLLLAGPTIAMHGTDEQKQLHLKDIVTGQKAWCQLFSEPGAGSDLAGLQTRAEKDGEEWIINGQKVWTSGGHVADMAILIARTDPDKPKHTGITYFLIEMQQAGIDVRALREMTGRAMFNEVFITDARVPDNEILGGRGNGWKVANTTLMFERIGLGAGGGSAAASAATPGTIQGDLERRVGDFVTGGGRRGGASSTLFGFTGKGMFALARRTGKNTDPSIRQKMVQLHTMGEVARYSNLRMKAAREAGRDIPGLPNIAKLMMSQMVRLSRDLGLATVGPYGTLHSYNSEDRKVLNEAVDMPGLEGVTEMALFAQGPPIYGGTDQVQRNIIGERILGLPREPGPDKNTPFKDLPKNG